MKKKETKEVNTIKFSSNNKTEGWNTDATGFLNLLKKNNLPASSAVVFGNGASSLSIICALKEFGIKKIYQIARKFDKRNKIT